jgi:hypothetical protein
MLRSVLCSYDWKSQTLFRETVLRMETPSIDYMSRIPRVKFGFERPSDYIPGEQAIPRSGLRRLTSRDSGALGERPKRVEC